MPIVNHLMSMLEKSNTGSCIRKKLTSGTCVDVIKENSKNTFKIIREKECGDKFITIMKKVDNKYILQSVTEEYRFGIININFKKDGSKHCEIRVCDHKGRFSKANNGFCKTSKEVCVFKKGEIITSPEIELKTYKNIKDSKFGFLFHMRKIRKNEAYCLHNKNFTEKEYCAYLEADEKRFAH